MAESITLQTSDNNVQQSDVLGRLSFAASNESSGSDARLIGASIYASAESDFTAISNATSLIFATASSENATERMRITSDGKVGIGTISPGSFNSYFNQLVLGDGSNYQGATIYSSTQGTLAFGDTATTTVDGYRGYLAYIHNTDYMILGTAGAERVRINSAGNIGIGTTSPSARLNVENGNVIFNDLGGNFDFRVEGDTDANLLFTDASTDRVGIKTSTPTVDLEVGTNNSTPRALSVRYSNIPAYLSNGFDGVYSRAVFSTNVYNTSNGSFSWSSPFGNTNYSAAAIDLTTNAFGGGSQIRFYTATINNTEPTERMHIDGDGNVGIGISSPQATLDVNGTVQFDNLVRWEFPDKPIDTSISALGYLRLYDESSVYCGLGVSSSSFNIGSVGGINLRLLTNGTERTIIDTNGNFIFNEAGNNCDFRVEGDTDPNLLFVDASVDDVGIGTNTPAAKLHIAGDTLFENLSYRRFTTSTAIATHFRKYTDIAHYANSVSTVAGSLRIEIPVTTSTMWSMDVVIVEYDGVNGNNIKTTNLTITGYTTNNVNRGVWTNNPSRISQVRFGRNTANNRTVILIDPISVFRYPKAYIKEINTHHSNETTFGNSANYAITITSDETNFTLNGTITNDQFIRDDKLVNTFGNQTVAGIKNFTGNVGVGTASPGSKLSFGTYFINSNTPTAAETSSHIRLYESGGTLYGLGVSSSALNIAANQTGASIRMHTASAERVRIDGIGNVGIGTSTPAYKLDVNGTFSANSINVNDQFTFPTVDGSSGQALVTNGSGVVSWSDIASANLTRGSFEVTSTQSTFTVSGGYTLNTLSVYYNGIKLLLGTDFTATNGTTFTLTNAAVNGDIIEYWALNSASSAVGNTSTGSVSVTSNQTVFNVTNGYTVGGLVVFVNGVKLVDGVDFTATNGSSFTLTSAATSGDIVDYVAYGAVVASSNLQKTGDTMTGNLTIGNGSDLIVEGDLIVAKYKEGFVNIGNAGSTQTIDISNGTLQTCILNSSCTFTMPTAEAGRSFTLLLKTGTGSFTSTFTNVKWPNDTAPTITTTANKMDILTFVSDGVNWYGNISQNYSV